jgi:choline kinase
LKCLIIAAGKGQRLSGCAESKPLLEVGGRPLIDWVILSARKAGIDDFVVVTGFAADKVESHLQRISLEEGLNIECVRNEEWEKENGLSVYKAAKAAGDRFILSMSDHIFDPETLKSLMNEKLPDSGLILAVDLRIEGNPLIDLDDVTKVLIEDGKIAAIGKTIETYNAFDTGLFFCSKGLFQALEESQRKGDFTLSGGVKRLAAAGRALVMDVDGRDWIDVDDPAAVRKAETLVASRI